MKKSAKRTIIVSAVCAIVLCASLIVGATFALFTSESPVNIAVTSGKVSVEASVENLKLFSHEDISMTTYEGTKKDIDGSTFITGGTAKYENGTLTLDKIVPGDGVSFEIAVTNNSNVAILYRVVVSDATGSNLIDALKVTVAGEEYYTVGAYTKVEANGEIDNIPVTIELPTYANNAYQDKTVELAITVEAVQGNASDESKPVSQPAGDPIVYNDGGEYEYNLTGISASGKDGVINVTNGTLTIDGSGQMQAVGELEAGTEYAMAVWANGADAKVIINGGSYSNSVAYVGNDTTHYDLIYAKGGAQIVINGGTFKSVNTRWTLNCKNGAEAGKTDGSMITVYGGRFYQFDPSNLDTDDVSSYLGEGCEVIQDGDWYVVINRNN